MSDIQAVRGMKDVLPDEVVYWQYCESIIRSVLSDYVYQEIRLPIVESTQLFKRAVGEVTDIVEKEMYTFDDRNGSSLSLRPEGTACCVRAGIEHGLLYNQIQKLWYMGPMFRHERPQKGRLRQFSQLGVEVFGLSDPQADAEIIQIGYSLWKALGIEHQVRLEINSLANPQSRARFKDALVDYFQSHFDELDSDSQRRLETNPLRILDSKNKERASLIAKAPQLSDYYDDESQVHFNQVLQYLDELEIPYVVNPSLVRGLDYYAHTVFEWVTDELGAQGTICAGGRYDQLVSDLGGKPTPAVGFAMGFERVVLMLKQNQPQSPTRADIYLITDGAQARTQALALADDLREQAVVSVITDLQGGSLKSQFKRANKSGAYFALVVGDDEIKNDKFCIKNLETGEQQQLDWDQLLSFLDKVFEEQLQQESMHA